VSSRVPTRVRAENAPAQSFTRMPCTMLQRKCACGGTVVAGGECAECRKKRLQRKLTVNQPGDRFEQEADRMADFVVHGDRQRPEFSNFSLGALQREEPKTPPKPDNYDEAISKILDALKKTPVAKELQAKAAEMGKDFISSVEGKVIAGSALGGALAAIIATNSKLPMQIPEFPLDFIAPGLKAKITWEGPAQSPTNAGLVLTTKSGVSVGASYTKTPASGGKPEEEKTGLTLTIPLGGSSDKKKGGPTAAEKYRAETARIAAEQEKFRQGMKTPGEKTDDKDFVDAYVRSKVDPTNPLGLPPLKKKEDLLMMRKAPNESLAAPTTVPPIVDDVLQSSGEPLEAGTRRFFEERFGYDFGAVRVHRDARAAESARSVHAQAYTVGHDIVFDSGGFAPQTATGRRLLAHELTHVVQQNATPQTVQRAVLPGLEVKGRETGTGEAGSWSVFFERNGTTLDSDGELAVLFAGGGSGKKKNFDLHGHISEDEAPTPADGKKLANDRIKTVDAELKSIGHAGKRNPKPKPDVGDGRLDYRNVRSVEIAAAGKKSTTLNCKTTARTGPCSAAVKKTFSETRKQAQVLIDKARKLLTSGTDSATNDLRDEFFGGAGGKGSGAAATKVLDENLGKIKSQMDLNAKSKHHRCGTLCDGACTIAIAYNEDVGNDSVLTLCPGFVKRDPVDRTRNFIHETAHGTPGLGLAGKTAGTKDLAYRFERRLPRLTPDQALQNSDSYALFVMLAAEPAFTRPRRPVDKLGVKSKEKAGVEDVLALLSDWVKWSNQDTTSTYSIIVESRAKKKWTNSYYEETMKLIAAQFGLTVPPKLPTDDDRFAVAGIVDRYETISNAVRKDLDVQRDPKTKTTTWSKGPGKSIQLGDDFFALKTVPERTRLLMRALVDQVGAILPAHRKKFVDLAEQIGARNPLP
jgi:hypothetical protein